MPQGKRYYTFLVVDFTLIWVGHQIAICNISCCPISHHFFVPSKFNIVSSFAVFQNNFLDFNHMFMYYSTFDLIIVIIGPLDASPPVTA